MATMTGDIPPALLERVEAEAYADYQAAASAEARAALGARQLRVGGGIALAMPNDPTGFWSKTLGLGFGEPISGELMEQVVGFYRAQGMAAARLHLAPEVLPPDWAGICAALNISESPAVWVKLAGEAGVVTDRGAAARLDAGLRVAPVSAALARDWATVMQEGFGLPVEHQVEMGTGSVGRPGWRSFAVFEGSDIVAAASLYVHGDAGHLFGMATLPRARRRGAQSALIAALARAACDAGCTWLVAETGAEGPGERNSSLHNMLRAGMTTRYPRRIWRWEAR